MSDYRVISADSHVFEPPDLWTSRIEAKLRDRAPYMTRIDGEDWFCCDGYQMIGLGGRHAAWQEVRRPGQCDHRGRDGKRSARCLHSRGTR